MNEPITIPIIVGVVTKYLMQDVKALLDKHLKGKAWATGVKLQAVVGLVALGLVWVASRIKGLNIDFDVQAVVMAVLGAYGFHAVQKQVKK